MRLLLVVAFAACGGSKASPTAYPPDEDPVFIDAGPDLLLPLELASERACACTDDGCRVAARDSLLALERNYTPKGARYYRILVALAKCLAPTLDEQTAADYPVAEEFEHNVCSCQSTACGTAVLDQYVEWAEAGGVIRSVVLAQSPFLDLVTSMSQCIDTLAFDGN